MHIGIPREIKEQEFRVAATPAGVQRLVAAGHRVTVERDAGEAIGFSADEYRAAGAGITTSAAEVYAAELVFKVKEPQTAEVALLRPGQILFCYLHLAAAAELAAQLLARGVTAIAFETVEDHRGATPLLAPMSRVAGRLAVQVGMQALELRNGGRGVLLAGVDAVPPGRVLIIGGGEVGSNALQIAHGIGAEVTLLDRDRARLEAFRAGYPERLRAEISTPAAIESEALAADLIIGAVYLHGRRAPKLISRELVRRLARGTAIIDVAIDQGGIAETSRQTSHAQPFFLVDGVVHYGVANMPGAVARTSTLALEHATLPYLLRLAADPRGALLADPGFGAGVNLAAGEIAHGGLALDMGRTAVDWRTRLSA